MLIRHASDQAKLDQGHYWDQSAGDKVVSFIETYLVLDNGKPFKLLPWQVEFIESIYCWKKPDGTRSIKIGLLSVGRKNGKSCLTYGLTAYHIIADGELSPSCVSAAVNREQASQIFDWFSFAIDANPKLAKALRSVPSKKTIFYHAKNGRYRSLASDTSGGNFGTGNTFVISDELAFHKKDDVFVALKNSTDAKPNELQLITSTAGWNKNGAFYKHIQYSRKVLSGDIIDTTYQPWIYEYLTEDHDDERNWYAANPSLGVVQSVDDYRAQWNRDRLEATSKLSFLRLKGNTWTDADAEDGWLDLDSWDACEGVIPDLTGCPVVLAADIGATRDLTAISLVAKVGDRYLARSWGFVPESALLTRDGTNTAIYQACQADGSLTITPGTATDEVKICTFLDSLCLKYKVQAVVFDRWQSLHLSNHLSKQGVVTLNFPQTHAYFNAPCLELEKLVGAKRITVEKNTLLRWQVGHTTLNRDNKGYVKPTTVRPENKKDNLISLLMALSQCLVQAQSLVKKESVYDKRGITTI